MLHVTDTVRQDAQAQREPQVKRLTIVQVTKHCPHEAKCDYLRPYIRVEAGLTIRCAAFLHNASTRFGGMAAGPSMPSCARIHDMTIPNSMRTRNHP
jgi:hypothetical protein